ncbi:MAG: hypothetical protein JSS22_12230, partial [Proteobacteria bacterium]|nr:hypothetical protein [Pseudomonadota bacterium]
GDKAVRAQSIRGYIERHGLYVPARAPWYAALRAEMLGFPAGRNDDMVDMLGLLGQLMDKMLRGKPLRPLVPPSPKDRWDKVFNEESDDHGWKAA